MQLPYVAYMSLFLWLLNNPNGPIKAPRVMNLLTKFQLDPTIDEAVVAIRKYLPSIEMLKTLQQCEMNFSLLKQRSRQSNWSHTKYEPADKISAQSNGEQNVCDSRKLLGKTFYYFFLFFALSVSAFSVFEKNPKS